MAKSRKLAGRVSTLMAIIFSGCVIGWLYCVKPQLLGSAVSGGAISSAYVILYLLWWGLALVSYTHLTLPTILRV